MMPAVLEKVESAEDEVEKAGGPGHRSQGRMPHMGSSYTGSVEANIRVPFFSGEFL